MLNQLLATKKYRYFCWAVYGLSVLAASILPYGVYENYTQPTDVPATPPPDIVYVLVALAIALINAMLFSGLVISRFSKNKKINTVFIFTFISIGLIYIALNMLTFIIIFDAIIIAQAIIHPPLIFAILIYILRIYQFFQVSPNQ